MRKLSARILATTSLMLASVSAHAAEGGMPQLDPTWIASQLFWLAVTFVVLYVLTAWNIIPKVSRVLQTRENALRENLGAAANFKDQADAARIAFEKAISDARTASAHTIAQVQLESNAALVDQQTALDAKLKEQLHTANAAIAQSLARVARDISPAAASLAAAVCTKLLGTNVSEADTKKHVTE